jgi:hypothetical protein
VHHLFDDVEAHRDAGSRRNHAPVDLDEVIDIDRRCAGRAAVGSHVATVAIRSTNVTGRIDVRVTDSSVGQAHTGRMSSVRRAPVPSRR